MEKAAIRLKKLLLCMVIMIPALIATPCRAEHKIHPACENYEFLFIQENGGFSCAPVPESGIIPKCGDDLPVLNINGDYGCREKRPHEVIIDHCNDGQRPILLDDHHVGCADR